MPRPAPGSPWRRRILAGAGLLLVLALLVWGVTSIAGRLLASSGSGGDTTQPVAQSDRRGQSTRQSGTATPDSRYPASSIASDGSVDGQSGETGTVRIPTCGTGDLGVRVGVEGSPVAVGAGATISVTVEDTSDIQCETAFGQMSVQVLSGSQTVYDSTSCEGRDTTATPLLLTPGATWTGTLTWSGRSYDGCTPLDVNGDGATDIAGAGTYRVQVLLGGVNLGNEQVFEVR